MEEIWKKIEGYDRYYISNYGRVKSFAQDKKNGKVLTNNIDHKGYAFVILYDTDGKKKTHKVHRLVANAFIDNPMKLPQVNHIDEDKLNNNVTNLEWCDNAYNVSYGTRSFRAGLSNRCCQSTSNSIYSIDSNGNVEYFDSIGDAERKTGLSHCNIVRTLKGRTRRCGNRTWFYCSVSA